MFSNIENSSSEIRNIAILIEITELLTAFGLQCCFLEIADNVSFLKSVGCNP